MPFVDSSISSKNLPAVWQEGMKSAKQSTLNLEL
jgi:hypothetical protein